jgi:DNA-binding protein H-NS
MATLKDLLDQRAELERQIAATRDQERTKALSQVRQLMADYGLTVADLAGGKRRAAASPVAAKYRNQATGETWSGRGLKPRWLTAAIAAGGKLEDFAV